MEPLGRDSPRSILREVLPASRGRGSRSRRMSYALVTVLTACGWVWIVLAVEALGELVSTLDLLIAAAENSRPTAMESAGPIDLSSVQPRFIRASAPPPLPIPEGPVLPHPTAPGRRIEEHAERPTPLDLPLAPEFRGAICSGVFVYIVTIAENSPSHSAVSFATSETAGASFAHPGERIDGWELVAITDDWTGANPVVWLLREDEVCRTGLTGNPSRLQAILRQEEQARQEQVRQAQQARQARRARRRRRRR
jgi:hypothetical protein